VPNRSPNSDPADDLIVDALEAALAVIRELPNSPQARALRAQARTYKRLLTKWEGARPTSAQVDTLFALVTELRETATAAQLGRVPPSDRLP
jgi:hypothetical protein